MQCAYKLMSIWISSKGNNSDNILCHLRKAPLAEQKDVLDLVGFHDTC